MYRGLWGFIGVSGFGVGGFRVSRTFRVYRVSGLGLWI